MQPSDGLAALIRQHRVEKGGDHVGQLALTGEACVDRSVDLFELLLDGFDSIVLGFA